MLLINYIVSFDLNSFSKGVSTGKLHEEIYNHVDITTPLIGVVSQDNEVLIHFESELSSEESILLNQLILAHDPTEETIIIPPESVSLSNEDTSPGYLIDKIIGSDTIDLSIQNIDGEQKVVFSAQNVGDITTGSNANTLGIGVFKQKKGSNLEFRGLKPLSTRLSLSLDVVSNTINMDVVPAAIEHSNLKNAGSYPHSMIDYHLVNTGNPHNVTATQISDLDLYISNNESVLFGLNNAGLTLVSANDSKSGTLSDKIIAGTDIEFNITNESGEEKLFISVLGGKGEVNTISSIGVGTSIFKRKNIFDLELKSLNSDNSIIITDNIDDISISVDQSNLSITASQITNLLSTVISIPEITSVIESNNKFKISSQDSLSGFFGDKILAGDNIEFIKHNLGSNEILTVNAVNVGEVNTGLNLGSGERVYKQKTGGNLEFKTLSTNSNQLSIFSNLSNSEIFINLDETKIDHTHILNSGVKNHAEIDNHINSIGNTHSLVSNDIPDFDVEVSNNIDVSNNTEARSKLKVSNTDTTSNFLLNKIITDSNFIISVDNQNLDEKLKLSLNGVLGEVNTASNKGSGIGIYDSKTETDLLFKSFISNSNLVDINSDLNHVYINFLENSIELSPSQISGLENYIHTDTLIQYLEDSVGKSFVSDTDNVLGKLSDKVTAGNNVEVITEETSSGNEILVINVPFVGEVTTASNVNTEGYGVFSEKSGTVLKFLGINTSGLLSISNNLASNSIIIDLDNSDIDHNLLINKGIYTHSQIDSHITSVNNPHNVLAAQIVDFNTQVSSNSTVTSLVSNLAKVKVDSVDATTGYLIDKLDSDGLINISEISLSGSKKIYLSIPSGLGEVNTVNSSGSGLSIYKSKSGSVLNFKSLSSVSPALLISSDSNNDNIIFDIHSGSINHDSLINSGVYSHQQVDSHLDSTLVHHQIDDNSSALNKILSSYEIDRRIQQSSSTSSFTPKGSWNAATNTPSITSGVGTSGEWYRVSVSGTTNIDGIAEWSSGDDLIFDGVIWRKIDNTDRVTSVFGLSGDVSFTTDTVSEGFSNLYFTESRVSNNPTILSLLSNSNKIKISSNDTASDFLLNKLSAGSNITLTEVNNGGYETLQISVLPTITLARNLNSTGVGVYESTTDGYLNFRGIKSDTAALQAYYNGNTKTINLNLITSNIDHTTLSNKGNFSHADIDQHIYSQSNPHNVRASQVLELSDYITNHTSVSTNTNARYKSKITSADTGPDYLQNKIVAGSNITVSTLNSGSSERLQINALPTGESNTASNIGTAGVGVYKQKSGIDLQFRKINSGSNKVVVSQNDTTNTVNIDLNVPNIDHTLLLNKGANTHSQIDSHIYSQSNPHNVLASQITDFNLAVANNSSVQLNTTFRNKVGVSSNDSNPEFLQNKITAGSGISVTALNDGGNETLSISLGSGAGEANTASNVGVSGVGVFKQKSGVDLQFKKINAITSPLYITDNKSSNSVDIGFNKDIFYLPASQVTDLDTYISQNSVVSSNYLSRGKVKISENDSSSNYLLYKLISGENVTLTEVNNGGSETLEISVPTIGEMNSASNVNTLGEGVFKQKVGSDLQFKGIASASSLLTVSNNTAYNAICLNVNNSEIDHTLLKNKGVNNHTQIDTHISDLTKHRFINDSSNSSTDLLSAAEINSRITSAINGAGTFSPDNYKMACSISISSTTSSYWQSKLSFNTGALPAGIYKVDWSYTWNGDSATSDFKSRIKYNGTVKNYQSTEPKEVGGVFYNTGTDQNIPSGGFFLVKEVSNVINRTIELDFCSETSGVKVSIWNVYICISRVSIEDLDVPLPTEGVD